MSLRSREGNFKHWHGTAYATKCEVRSHPQNDGSENLIKTSKWMNMRSFAAHNTLFHPTTAKDHPKGQQKKVAESNNSSACTDQPLLLLITDRTELI
ncbi:hypothetical protein niasHS_015999 [Heterodera schachtii]|uniref:Uncharacterized protein n=2 Tax=Heterodera TaxID=34509 RepID=A0ABD2HY66_HETSC